MKLNKLILVLTTCLIPLTAVQAETIKGCAAKKQNIETQLKYAKDAGNIAQVRGLEKALKENTEHCNDNSLNNKRNKKIQEKEQKVEKAKRELQEAKSKGDTNKITKKQDKLNKAQAELNQAKKNLNQ